MSDDTEHERWARWMRYMNWTDENVARLKQQMVTRDSGKPGCPFCQQVTAKAEKSQRKQPPRRGRQENSNDE